MSIGTGIALAGVWVFAAVCVHSERVTPAGTLMVIGIAMILTVVLEWR